MIVLLSAVGPRGDVRPLVALALELQARGHEPRLCIPADLVPEVRRRGVRATPLGPRGLSLPAPGSAASATPARLQAEAARTVDAQFDAIGAAAVGCDLMLAGGALQLAARSVAERLGIGFVHAAYSPVTLPSPDHAPPGRRSQDPAAGARDNRGRWAADAASWNARFLGPLNLNRSRSGLAPLRDVRSHILTDRPLLAADPVLAPAPDTPGMQVVRTGAWLLPASRPLPARLDRFLQAGQAPVHIAFDSTPVSDAAARAPVEAVRALGRRVVVSRGWAGPRPLGASDCLVVEDVDLPALIGRVAAVVHHGGAGTTTAAAAAGVPQVVRPTIDDQFYWAERVEALGVGSRVEEPGVGSRVEAPAGRAEAQGSADRGGTGEPGTGPATGGRVDIATLAAALEQVLEPRTVERAAALAPRIVSDGTATAAAYLLGLAR